MGPICGGGELLHRGNLSVGSLYGGLICEELMRRACRWRNTVFPHVSTTALKLPSKFALWLVNVGKLFLQKVRNSVCNSWPILLCVMCHISIESTISVHK